MVWYPGCRIAVRVYRTLHLQNNRSSVSGHNTSGLTITGQAPAMPVMITPFGGALSCGTDLLPLPRRPPAIRTVLLHFCYIKHLSSVFWCTTACGHARGQRFFALERISPDTNVPPLRQPCPHGGMCNDAVIPCSGKVPREYPMITPADAPVGAAAREEHYPLFQVHFSRALFPKAGPPSGTTRHARIPFRPVFPPCRDEFNTINNEKFPYSSGWIACNISCFLSCSP